VEKRRGKENGGDTGEDVFDVALVKDSHAVEDLLTT
jgi:hypothetical protein